MDADGGGSDTRPNLLIVYPDQWRGSALGCAGDPVTRTPVLDALAREAVCVSRAYAVYPLCTPSRASLLTGRYPHATGVAGNNAPLPVGEVAFSEVLAAAGYRTGYIGKWHLDGDDKPGFVPPGPRRHGFAYWAAFNRGHEYYAPVYYRDTDEPIASTTYEPDLQTDLGVAFLRDPDPRPFCLLLSWGPPHTPLRPPPRTAGMYREEDFTLPPSVPEAEAARARRERPAYAGLVTSLDLDMGRLLRALQESGRARDTIVCFTSDHGYLMGEHGRYGKARPEEEAIHVPFLLRWPGRLEARWIDDLLLSSVDVAPTLLGLCGLSMPRGIHGRDLSASLCRPGVPTAGTDAVYLEGHIGGPNAWRAVRTRTHLLVGDGRGEPTHLYDLRSDPFELDNLIAAPYAADVRAEMTATLRRLARETGDAAIAR